MIKENKLKYVLVINFVVKSWNLSCMQSQRTFESKLDVYINAHKNSRNDRIFKKLQSKKSACDFLNILDLWINEVLAYLNLSWSPYNCHVHEILLVPWIECKWFLTKIQKL